MKNSFVFVFVFFYFYFYFFMRSGVLDQNSTHAETQSFRDSLHPYSLPVVLEPDKQLFPTRHLHEISVDR